MLACTAIASGVAAAASPPPGSACGQTIDLPAQQSPLPGPPPLAVGDSVLYDAAQPLAAYGFHINSMVCRTMAQGITWLKAHDVNLPFIVVVALGTNGGASAAQVDELLGLVGSSRILELVTPHHGTDRSTPALYRSLAQSNPGRIKLLDWDALSTGHPGWFAGDGIHLGGSAGIAAYAQLIESALSVATGTVSTTASSTAPPVTTTPAPATTTPKSTTVTPKPTHPARRTKRATATHLDGTAILYAAQVLAAIEGVISSLPSARAG